MGKKVRERKLLKIEEKKFEKKAIEERKKNIARPYIVTSTRILITLILTVLLIYIGTFANKKIQANEGGTATQTPTIESTGATNVTPDQVPTDSTDTLPDEGTLN